MRTIIKSFVSAFVVIGILSVTTEAVAFSSSKTVSIKTSAICNSCKARIEKALKAAEGVEDAILNLNNLKVKVKYDPAVTTPEKLREVVSNTGYDADEVKANGDAYSKLPGCCKKQGGACTHSME